MATRLLLPLWLQLGAVAAASCSCLIGASCPVDAAPLPPSRGVPATAVATPAPAGVPRAAADNGTGVPTTAAPDDVAAVVFRGARRLGPPRHHLRLSNIAATATATVPTAATSSDVPADTPAVAPSGAHGAGHQSLLVIFIPVLFILGCGLFVAGLFKSADLYEAAKTRHQKARRVRPLDEDAVEAAGH